MRQEIARVRWWRRLVKARRDLTLALLARPDGADSPGLDLSWEALAAGAPTTAELAAAVWPEAGEKPAASAAPSGVNALEYLDRLDQNLAAYEARVVATLDNVTAQMVRALAHGHQPPHS